MQHDLLVNKLNKLNDALSHIEKQIRKTMAYVNEISRDLDKKDYSDVPGVLGTFDGVAMVAQDGQKYPVPANYAAKSRMVFGDKLKMIQEGDSTVFKLVDKVAREKIDGIVTKKDGKWHVISSAGSYRISDTAAEFNKLSVNDEIQALIPRGNYSTPYAAFDKLTKGEKVTTPLAENNNALNVPKPVNVDKKPQASAAAPTPPKPMSQKPAKAPSAVESTPVKKATPVTNEKPSDNKPKTPAAPAPAKKQQSAPNAKPPVKEMPKAVAPTEGAIPLDKKSTDASGVKESIEEFDLR